MAFLENLLQNEYLMFLVILIGAILISEIFLFILKKHVKRLTEKTKTDIDDEILEIIMRPAHILIILAGISISTKSLSLLVPYLTWIDGAVFVAGILIVSFAATKIISVLIERWLKVQKKFEKTPRLISKIVTVTVYFMAFLTILSHFGIQITPLIATLGIGGLAVGLALQNTLSNFFSGLHIISDKPIGIGDFIELPDANISGFVEDIGWRSTRIRTLPNTIVIVPNTKLSESIIVNNSLPEQEMAALVQVGVAYGSDLEKVEKATVDVAKKIQKTVSGAVKNFEPFIRYHTFGDSNINFSVILRVEKFVDQYLVKHEFIKALKERYDKEGIEISWPVRKIYTAK